MPRAMSLAILALTDHESFVFPSSSSSSSEPLLIYWGGGGRGGEGRGGGRGVMFIYIIKPKARFMMDGGRVSVVYAHS